MACPCFVPVQRLRNSGKIPAPLGDCYEGWCRSNSAVPFYPDAATLLDFCNMGYARGRCARFPEGNGPDAVRFSVSRHCDGRVRIFWVRERDHHPFDHGTLEYSIAERVFTEAPADDAVPGQARAYIESYLRRKSQP